MFFLLRPLVRRLGARAICILQKIRMKIRLNPLLPAVWLALIALLRAEISFVNPTGVPLASSEIVAPFQFLGSRFVVTSPLHVSSIEVTIASANNRYLFVAIVALPQANALPIPSAESGLQKSADIRFTTLFNPGEIKNVAKPISIPVSTHLSAGAYAVVIGAGLFGSPGGDFPDGPMAALQTYALVPGSDKITWGESIWHGTGYGEDSVRIALTGTSSPSGLADSAMPITTGALPALPSAVFDPADNADTAARKIQNYRPEDLATTLALQRACRDFCAQFPLSLQYPAVRRAAASSWSSHGYPEAAFIEGWDPTDAERDPMLNAEQQADIAMIVATATVRATRRRNRSGSAADAEFDAIAAAVPKYLATTTARDNLIRRALSVAPGKAIPKLRELYPDDPNVAACILLLTGLDKPFEFHCTALDGRNVDSHDYAGKVLLLEFWAKGCGPCLALMPDLKKLAERYGPKGFAIIGVNLDEHRADAEEIVRKFALAWPQCFDGGGWKSAMAMRFQVTAIPYTALIDRRGILRDFGNISGSELNKRIETLLREKPDEQKT